MLNFVALKQSVTQPGHDPYVPQDAPVSASKTQAPGKLSTPGAQDMAAAPQLAPTQRFQDPQRPAPRAGLPARTTKENQSAPVYEHMENEDVVVRAPQETRAGPLPPTNRPMTSPPRQHSYMPQGEQRQRFPSSRIIMPGPVVDAASSVIGAIERIGQSHPARPSTAAPQREAPREEIRMRDSFLDRAHDAIVNNTPDILTDMPREGRINPDSARPTPRAGLDIMGGARRMMSGMRDRVDDILGGPARTDAQGNQVRQQTATDRPLAPGTERGPMGRATIPPPGAPPRRPSVNRQPAPAATETVPLDYEVGPSGGQSYSRWGEPADAPETNSPYIRPQPNPQYFNPPPRR